MTAALIEAVAHGTETIETCPACFAERVTTQVHALAVEGVIFLGMLIDCDGCGMHFLCAACASRVAGTPAEIVGHIREQHGVTE